MYYYKYCLNKIFKIFIINININPMSKNSSSNIPPNVLFFSKKCKTCNLFITMCQQNKILKYFQMIDVDDKIKELSEKGLKIVPTIIIKGLSKPIEGKLVFSWLESVISMNSNKKIDTSEDQYLPETGIQQTQTQSQTQSQTQTINQSRPTNGSGTINPNNNVVKRNVVAPPPIIGAKQVKQEKNEQGKIPEVKIVNGVEIKKTNGPSVKSQPFGFLQDEMSGFSDSFAYLMTDNPLPKAFLPCDKDLQIYTPPRDAALDEKQQNLLMKNIEMIRDNDKNSFVKIMDNEHQQIMRESNKKN